MRVRWTPWAALLGESVADASPCREGGAIVRDDHVGKAADDGGVNPEDDPEISLEPVWIGDVGVGLLVDAVESITLGKDEAEKGAPAVIVVGSGIEFEVYIGVDIGVMDSRREEVGWRNDQPDNYSSKQNPCSPTGQ